MYSKNSRDRLDTVDPRLQRIFEKALQEFDHTIIQGYRTKEEQNKYFREGKSQLQYPNSKHNSYPSKAVDAGPYDSSIRNIPWNDREWFHYFAGYVMGIAAEQGIKLRWGGDWQRRFAPNRTYRERPFDDLPHFEIVDD